MALTHIHAVMNDTKHGTPGTQPGWGDFLEEAARGQSSEGGIRVKRQREKQANVTSSGACPHVTLMHGNKK